MTFNSQPFYFLSKVLKKLRLFRFFFNLSSYSILFPTLWITYSFISLGFYQLYVSSFFQTYIFNIFDSFLSQQSSRISFVIFLDFFPRGLSYLGEDATVEVLFCSLSSIYLDGLRYLFSVIYKGLFYSYLLGLETLAFGTLLGTLKVLVILFGLDLLFTLFTYLALLLDPFTFFSYFAEEVVLKFLILFSTILNYLILGGLLLLRLVSLLFFSDFSFESFEILATGFLVACLLMVSCFCAAILTDFYLFSIFAALIDFLIALVFPELAIVNISLICLFVHLLATILYLSFLLGTFFVVFLQICIFLAISYQQQLNVSLKNQGKQVYKTKLIQIKLELQDILLLMQQTIFQGLRIYIRFQGFHASFSKKYVNKDHIVTQYLSKDLSYSCQKYTCSLQINLQSPLFHTVNFITFGISIQITSLNLSQFLPLLYF